MKHDCFREIMVEKKILGQEEVMKVRVKMMV
jgi:hypothetical protein